MGEWARTIDSEPFDPNQDWKDCFSTQYPQCSVFILSIRLLVQTLGYTADHVYSLYA